MVNFVIISTLLIGYMASIQCIPVGSVLGGGGGNANGGLGIGNGVADVVGDGYIHGSGLLHTTPPPPKGKAHGDAGASGTVRLANGLVRAHGKVDGGAGGKIGSAYCIR
ncbi:unnamed protein product [Cunninghamella blakesleeana]